MKKFMMVLIICFSTLGITACAQTDTNASGKQESQQTADQSKQKIEYPFPEGLTPTGNAKLLIVTKTGTSDNGAIPVVSIKKGATVEKINLNFINFSKNNSIILYVDKEYRIAKKGGELLQSPLTLRPSNALKVGVHTVTAVQFENNDPKGKIVNFTEAKFEVKETK